MPREIKLDGGEITVLKAIGLSNASIDGKLLLDQIGEMIPGELLETLDGLLTMGYVLSTRVNVRKIEDVERAFFRVNPSHLRDLRDAITPSRDREQHRARRERRG